MHSTGLATQTARQDIAHLPESATSCKQERKQCLLEYALYLNETHNLPVLHRHTLKKKKGQGLRCMHFAERALRKGRCSHQSLNPRPPRPNTLDNQTRYNQKKAVHFNGSTSLVYPLPECHHTKSTLHILSGAPSFVKQ